MSYDIVQKLWNLCNVLRDDGVSYHQYVNELTYILFLKMANEKGIEENIPKEYRWGNLVELSGEPLYNKYKEALLALSQIGGDIGDIYNNAQTSIAEPKNIKKIFTEMDKLDWFSQDREHLGDLYEGLLEKNAGEKKSGAGQYFTPRPLVNVMVRLMKPEMNDRICDPACGTLGFLISADNYLREKKPVETWKDEEYEFLANEKYDACELVVDTRRLGIMNAMLHNMKVNVVLGDALSETGKVLENYDLILSNPPFGTKKGGEKATRDDLTHTTSNKQLNFLQVIYNSLKNTGTARAAVVLPDNVLFEDGVGKEIRKDLLNKCNLHTILRLPTGIFYAQGVKTNVLFFTKGISDKENTKEVWYYDLRTNMKNFGKTNPLKEEHFEEFENSFNVSDSEKDKIERWTKYSIEEIEKKGFSLDLGLIKDDSVIDYEDLPDPVESVKNNLNKLREIKSLFEEIMIELK